MSAEQLRAAYLAGAVQALRYTAHPDPTAANRMMAVDATEYAAKHAAPKAKRKSSKAAAPAGMSMGGDAYGEACRKAPSWEAMQPGKLRARVAAICARKEGKPGAPPAWSRFHFYYSPDPIRQAVIAGKMAELAKLGVQDISCQSREEWEAQERRKKYEEARGMLRRSDGVELGSRFASLEKYTGVVKDARTVARELLSAGDRHNAVDLARETRALERRMRERWPEEYKRHAAPTLAVV